jgi:adenylate cyclase
MRFIQKHIKTLTLFCALIFLIVYALITNSLELKLCNILICVLTCIYLYKYISEDFKKNKIKNAMGKYLSYDIMEKVVNNIDNISLGGKRANVTVLFADIRNFTTISEKMNPDLISEILNEYFSALVPIIEEHNGVLNKFVGDAMLVIFGEPKKSETHALDAVRCGIRMLKKVKYLQEKWLEEGKPKIEIGIGISTGEAFVGNVGSKNRLEYTVLGDTVNTASRIENYNKVYKTNFLVSESTYQKVKSSVDAITIKNVAIKGKTSKINLYEILRLVNS